MSKRIDNEGSLQNFLEWVEDEEAMLQLDQHADGAYWWGRAREAWGASVELTQELQQGAVWFVNNLMDLSVLSVAIQQAPGARRMKEYLKNLPGWQEGQLVLVETDRQHIYCVSHFSFLVAVAKKSLKTHAEGLKGQPDVYWDYPSLRGPHGKTLLTAEASIQKVFLEELDALYNRRCIEGVVSRQKEVNRRIHTL